MEEKVESTHLNTEEGLNKKVGFEKLTISLREVDRYQVESEYCPEVKFLALKNEKNYMVISDFIDLTLTVVSNKTKI